MEKVEDALKEGDKVRVKLIDIDPKTGKFKLSRKVLLPKPEGMEQNDRPRGDRQDRGPRQDRGDRPNRDRGPRPERREE